MADRQWERHSGPVVDSKEDFDIIECAACGFRHIVPIPSAEELERLYRHAYYTKDKPLMIERQAEDRQWHQLVNTERLETIEAALGGESKRILDVGCGPGLFLETAKERGWECLGLEPSGEAAAHARSLGIDIVEAVLSAEVSDSLGTFDAVTMSQVLEHVPDPQGILDLARSLLKPGGVAMATVPNDYNPIQMAYTATSGTPKWWLAPPHHINYFTPESLVRLFEARSYQIIETTTTFPIDFFLLMGDNYIGDDAMGRMAHERRKRFELNMADAGRDDLRRKIYAALSELDIGREIRITARRPK